MFPMFALAAAGLALVLAACDGAKREGAGNLDYAPDEPTPPTTLP